MTEDDSVELTTTEVARRIYRTLEMSAAIMRDPARTGAWEGAERTASAFERQAVAAKRLYNRLAVLASAPDRAYVVENTDGHFVASFATGLLADIFISDGNGCYRHRPGTGSPNGACLRWVPAIGDRVEVTDDMSHAAAWRETPLYVAGVSVHESGDGYDVTVSERWPVGRRGSRGYIGLTDGFRIGALTADDDLRPTPPARLPGESTNGGAG